LYYVEGIQSMKFKEICSVCGLKDKKRGLRQVGQTLLDTGVQESKGGYFFVEKECRI